jgi:hypothetical protein
VSEYQYYEFQALDKPLTKQQQKELRSLSSRAEITATSFVNEYNYGDFRGEPQKLMERYFDAFCYLANWGTRRLMFRLPKTVLDARTARRYCHSDAASVTETADHVIIGLCLDRDPDDEWLEGSGLLAGMVQARSDLAAGDLRLLYLAWLLGIQRADEEDDDLEDETEPPVPAGLGDSVHRWRRSPSSWRFTRTCWPWPPRQARKPQSPSPAHWPRGFSLSPRQRRTRC